MQIQQPFLNLYPKALQLAAGQMVDPVGCLLHITNACCDRCEGCECASVHGAKASIDRDRLFPLLDEIRELGCRSIVFTGGGEPSMHPDFAQALSHAKSNGLMVGILSNGAGINTEVARCVVEKASFIRISVDASSPETFSRVRGVPPGEFTRRISVLRTLVEQRQAVESRVSIGMKFLIRPSNIDEMRSFAVMAEQIGVDNIQFKPLRHASAEPSPQDMARAGELVGRIRDEHPNIEVRGGIDAIRCETPCWISPLRTVITAEGDVVLCNYYMLRRKTHTFGNIHQKSLKDIWAGDEHREALGRIDKTECEFFDCRFHRLNTELRDLLDNHKPHLDFI